MPKSTAIAEDGQFSIDTTKPERALASCMKALDAWNRLHPLPASIWLPQNMPSGYYWHISRHMGKLTPPVLVRIDGKLGTGIGRVE